MAETRQGLRIQTAHSIAANTRFREQLQANLSKADENDDHVLVDTLTVRALILRLNAVNALLQKYDQRVTGMAQTIADLQK